MINLLPRIEKRKLQKEFYLRYAVVTLCLVAFLEGLLFASQLPAYLALHTHVGELASSLEEKKKQVLPQDGETQNQLNEMKAEIDLLKQGNTSKQTPPSVLLTNILSQKPDGILVSRFSYMRSGTGSLVQLNGIADAREDLLLFQKLLSNKEKNPHFTDIKYAQNFILKKTDIDFQLSMTIN